MARPLFFSKSFREDFVWKNCFHLRVGSVLPQNKEQISDSLKFMSSTTIRNRFSGSKREFTESELQYLTVLDGINHYAIGIEEARYTNRGVGLVRMVRSSTDSSEAEIAITLIDEYQNMGLGTFLLNLMVLAASERGINALSFTFMPSNEGIYKLIRRIGPIHQIPASHDDTHVKIFISELDLEEKRDNLGKVLPEIFKFEILK